KTDYGEMTSIIEQYRCDIVTCTDAYNTLEILRYREQKRTHNNNNPKKNNKYNRKTQVIKPNN
ncbi:MAG: hypothetical protein ACKPKO_05680, partial [Candidatus Fonsibacter sp.]